MGESLDWWDIALHGAVGAAAGIAAFFLGAWLLLGNAAFWFCREAGQRRQKGQPYSRLFTEPQVILEWALPLVTAPLAYRAAKAVSEALS